MKSKDVIALIVAVLGLAAAFQEFFHVDFFLKLLALAVGGFVLAIVAAVRLASWVRPKNPVGFPSSSAPLTWKRLVVAVGLLGALCLAFSTAAFVILKIAAINVELVDKQNEDVSELWIHASREAADNLTVLLPPRSKLKCSPIDYSVSQRPNAVMVDWDTANPQLHVDKFVYPQRQGLSCAPYIKLDGFTFRVEPGMEVFLPDRRNKFNIGFFALGGVLWLITVLITGLRSRR